MTLDRIDPERYTQWRTPAGSQLLLGLEALRQAEGYEQYLEVAPDTQHVGIAPGATWDHRLPVRPGSWLFGLSGSTANATGFTLQVTDLGTRSNLFSGSIKSKALFGASTVQVRDCTNTARNIFCPLHLLGVPRPILPASADGSGVLNIQVTNLDASNTQNVQIVIWLYRPKPGAFTPNAWDRTLQDRLAQWMTKHPTPNAVAADAMQRRPIDPSMSKAAYNRPYSVAGTGPNVIIPGVPGKRIAVHELSVYNTTEQNLRFLNNVADLTGPVPDFAAGSFYFLAYQEEPHWILDDGAPFQIDLSAISGGSVGTINGFVKYRLFAPEFTPGQ